MHALPSRSERTNVSDSCTGDGESSHSESSLNSGGSSITEESFPFDIMPGNPSVALIDLSNLVASKTESDQKREDFVETVLELSKLGNIVLQSKIGSGNYGVVYRGALEYFDDRVEKVAVKKLDPLTMKPLDFSREVDIMCSLKHPNIVRIIAHTQWEIVMEYVEHKSFLMYLSSKSPILTDVHLIKFSKDIALGLEYLVGKKIVHRDLAARNVLVDHDDCVKISDFGLAQRTDDKGYYIRQNVRAVPINW